jgi:hypothetical protein
VHKVVSGVVSGVVVAAFSLAALPAASVAVTEPTISSQEFRPDYVFFTSADSRRVAGAVQVQEPDGWTLQSAFVPDPSCAPQGQRPTTGCPHLLRTTSSSKVLHTRKITLTGALPNTLADGTLNRLYQGPRVYLNYTDDTCAEHLIIGNPAFRTYGGVRSQLSGPASVPTGGALTLTSVTEKFTTRWVRVSTAASLQFSSALTGYWVTVDSAISDNDGTIQFHRPAVEESGTWRVRLTGSPGTVSNPVHVRAAPVPPGSPPSAPGATVGGRTDHSVTVKWAAPSRPNGTLVAYRWGWTSSTGRPQKTWTTYLTANSSYPRHPFVIGRLSSGTRYRIWVQATNANGPGAKRTVVATTLPRPAHRPSAPRRPQTQVGSHRAVLVWEPPKRTGGAVITSYQVRRGTAHARPLPATARRAVFTGLQNGHRYDFYVRAHNRRGYGPWARTFAVPQAAEQSHCG